MQLELRMRNANLMESVREYAQRRLNFALDRYGSRIRRVTVRITDLNGPRAVLISSAVSRWRLFLPEFCYWRKRTPMCTRPSAARCTGSQRRWSER
jgi:hypothetical protein